jgi:hypothetical protein
MKMLEGQVKKCLQLIEREGEGERERERERERELSRTDWLKVLPVLFKDSEDIRGAIFHENACTGSVRRPVDIKSDSIKGTRSLALFSFYSGDCPTCLRISVRLEGA